MSVSENTPQAGSEAEAGAAESFREVEGGITWSREEEGEICYLFQDGKEGYFLLTVNADMDGDSVYARIKAEPEA